jgi:transposase InsO family protein
VYLSRKTSISFRAIQSTRAGKLNACHLYADRAASRRVVGWAVSDRMKKDLAIRALDMAVLLRNPPQAAFSIRIAAANIASMLIRKSCRPMVCVHQ